MSGRQISVGQPRADPPRQESAAQARSFQRIEQPPAKAVAVLRFERERRRQGRVERREILRQQRHAGLIGARGRLQRRQGTTMRAQKGGIILRRIEREVREEGVHPLMTRHGRFAQGLTSAAGIRGFRHSAVLKGMTGEFFDLN